MKSVSTLIQTLEQTGPTTFHVSGEPVTLEAQGGELYTTGNLWTAGHVTQRDLEAMVRYARERTGETVGFFKVEGQWFTQTILPEPEFDLVAA